MKIWRAKAEFKDRTVVDKDFPVTANGVWLTEGQEKSQIENFMINIQEDPEQCKVANVTLVEE